MIPVNALLVDPDAARCKRVDRILLDLPVNVRHVSNASEAGFAVAERVTQIAIIRDHPPNNESVALCDVLRLAHQRETLHIILVVDEEDEIRLTELLRTTIDDYIVWPAGETAFRLRVETALRRVTQENKVTEEREYFRRAVLQEETLTSRILDENLGLRRQYEELQDGFRTSPLTGLLNLHSLVDLLDVEVERSLRSFHPLAGFMLAIDQSREIQERVGLEAMNRIMTGLSHQLCTGLRKYDLSGHYYDSLIFVALPGADLDRAYLVANRFLSSGERIQSRTAGLGVRVTLSMGVAQFKENESRESWLERGRSAVARAQAQGGAHIQRERRVEDRVATG